MSNKRKIEVFSAGCYVCSETIKLVNSLACPSCDVSVLDMKDANVVNRAKGLNIRSVPAIVIDGKVAECCTGRRPDGTALKGLVGDPQR